MAKSLSFVAALLALLLTGPATLTIDFRQGQILLA